MRRSKAIAKEGMNGMHKVKATWENHIVHDFCDLCIKEIEIGNRPGTHLSRVGWKHLLTNFSRKTGREYDRSQLKNKWDQLKKDWKQWKQLLDAESDVKWDPAKRALDASTEWWQDKLKVVPEAKKFRLQGIEPELEEKLDKMFMNTVFTGEEPRLAITAEATADSTGDVGNQDENFKDMFDKADGYHGTNHVEPEGLGQKKRAGEQGAIQEGKKHARPLVGAVKLSSQPCDGIGSKSTAMSVRKMSSGCTITEAIRELDAIEVPKASPLYYFATKLILNKDKREVFMALAPDTKVWWIKMEEKESQCDV